MISSVFPKVGVGHTNPLALVPNSAAAALFYALSTSFVLDYVIRQKIAGTHLTYGYVEQLPMPSPSVFEELARGLVEDPIPWVVERVIELTYSAYDVAPFAQDLRHHGEPFRWDVTRRRRLRAELEALFLHVYGLSEADAENVLDSFAVVNRKDRDSFGARRTTDEVITAYRAMSEALASRVPYRTTIAPPPGHGSAHDGR